jgi:hypothetical protein
MASSFRFARAMEAEILWPFLWTKIAANSAVPIPRGTRPKGNAQWISKLLIPKLQFPAPNSQPQLSNFFAFFP